MPTTLRARLPVALTLCVALGSGCATPSVPPSAPSRPGFPAAAPASTHSRTLAAMRALVRRTPVPAGSHRVVRAPGLPGPAMGTPHTSSLVDVQRVWRVPMPFDATRRWLRAHPPTRLPAAGSSSGVGARSRSTVGYDWTGPSGAAWAGAQLEVDLTPDGRFATYWRTDALAEALDAHPLRDSHRGRTLDVAIAHGCPEGDRARGDVAGHGAGLTNALLPVGRPTQALICRYHGLNGHPFRLAAQRRLAAAAAGRLARLVRATSLAHTDGGVVSCPMADGSAVVLAFRLLHGRTVELYFAQNGCQYLDNGVIRATPSSRFVGAVARLVGSPSP